MQTRAPSERYRAVHIVAACTQRASMRIKTLTSSLIGALAFPQVSIKPTITKIKTICGEFRGAATSRGRIDDRAIPQATCDSAPALAVKQINNQILRLLSPSELDRVISFAERVSLRPRQVLQHWRLPMEHVYFVESGLVSVSAKIASERFVEVWFIGLEGVVGAPLVLTDDIEPPHRRVVQVEGEAWRISVRDFKLLLDELPTLRDAVMRYLYVVLLQTSQTGACNSLHSIRQRISRWLLLVRNALGSDVVPLTHEVLGRVLGVRRASVTECLDALQREGCIASVRGEIQIDDVKVLQSHACDCYRIIERQYRRHMNPSRASDTKADAPACDAVAADPLRRHKP